MACGSSSHAISKQSAASYQIAAVVPCVCHRVATLATGTCLVHVAMLVQQERMAGQLQHREAGASCRAALHTQGRTGQVRQVCADHGAECVATASVWSCLGLKEDAGVCSPGSCVALQLLER